MKGASTACVGPGLPRSSQAIRLGQLSSCGKRERASPSTQRDGLFPMVQKG